MWQNRLRYFPLLGGLVDCTAKDHWDSLGQLVVITVLSTAPLWLASFMLFGSGPKLDIAAFLAALQEPVSHGELYMYCTTMLAPIFWIALVEPRGARREFPSRVSHMFLIAIIDLISAMCFGAVISGRTMNEKFTLVMSAGLFLFSLALLYVGTVYHVHQVPIARDSFTAQEKEFSDELRRHRQ